MPVGPFQSFVVYDATTVANFKAVRNFISGNLSSMGWTQTADNGQVNWANVTQLAHVPSFTARAEFVTYNYRGSWVAPTGVLDAYSGLTPATAVADPASVGCDIVTYGGLTWQCLYQSKAHGTSTTGFIANLRAQTALTLNIASCNTCTGTSWTLTGSAGGSSTNGLGLASTNITAATVTGSTGGAGTGYVTFTIPSTAAAGSNGFVGYAFATTANGAAGPTFPAADTSLTTAGGLICTQSTTTSITVLLTGGASYTYASGANPQIFTDFSGWCFKIAGFVNTQNNGYFLCSASTSTTLVFNTTNPGGTNYAGTAETIAATASSQAGWISMTSSGVFNQAGTGATAPVVTTATQTSLNNYQGYTFTTYGFLNSGNNGTFTCLAACANTMTLVNPNAVSAGVWMGGPANAGSIIYVGPPITTVSGTITDVITSGGNVTTITCTNTFVTGMYVYFAGLNGGSDATFLNGTNINTYQIVSANGSSFTINTTGHTSTHPTVTTGTATVTGSTFNNFSSSWGFWQPYHYEVWQTNDGFTPILLRINYMANQITNTTNWCPAVSFQVGYTSNGNGFLIQNQINGTSTTAVETTMFGNVAAVNNLTEAFECSMAGTGTNSSSGAWLAIGMWRGNSSITQMFALERSLNSAGAAVDAYFTAWYYGKTTTTSTQQSVSKPGTGSQSAVYTWVYVCPGSSKTISYNGLNSALPVFPLIGILGNPATCVMATTAADTVDGQLFQAALYGTTHTYMSWQGGGTTLIVIGNPPAIRFEAA